MARILPLILAVAAVVVSGGCAESSLGTRVGLVYKFSSGTIQTGAGAKKAKNLYYRFLSKTNGRQLAEVRLPGQEVHAPFRIEARIGDFSAKQVRWDEDAAERFFITDPNFQISLHFVELVLGENGEATEARLTVRAALNEVNQPDLRLTVPDTRLVDVAMEHTGTEFIYSAKSAGSSQWMEIGRTATTFTGPFVMTFDSFGLPKKAEAGIDDIIVVKRAVPPDLDTAQKRAAFAGTQAFDDLLVAAKAVDGPAGNADAAKIALADAVAHVGDATTELGAVTGDTKKASKSLATASKKMSAALKKLNKGKAPSSTVKLLKTALQKLGLAIALIRDA